MLGADEASRAAALGALGAFPGGLQLGGGVTTDNAREWLDAGASHVIVTSFVFRDGRLEEERLAELVRALPECGCGGGCRRALAMHVLRARPGATARHLLPCPSSASSSCPGLLSTAPCRQGQDAAALRCLVHPSNRLHTLLATSRPMNPSPRSSWWARSGWCWT